MQNFWVMFAIQSAIAVMQGLAATGKLSPTLAEKIMKAIPDLLDIVAELQHPTPVITA